MHWERLKNKRTRIQIRKAQGWGCRGNLQQAPSPALSLCGVGARTRQAASAVHLGWLTRGRG